MKRGTLRAADGQAKPATLVLNGGDYVLTATSDGWVREVNPGAFYENDLVSVWANEKGRIVRRTLTLGGYDELAGRHEVLSGLSLEDAIAFPEDWITPGAPTTTVRAAPAANPDGGAGLPADGDVYEFGFDESESVPVDDMGDAGYDPEAKG